ncbi:helix-turn-helix transcriptional regulator [Nonomuraea sp. NPDC050310]|uniref:helix-turn-helix domain-containing protein n=1 Tax=Nonomuraea sp. NPDC050310 TaxID=3154935 RepID=UPI0033C0901F
MGVPAGSRGIAGWLKLAVKYDGASQVRLSVATGISQPRISAMVRGSAGPITELAVFERVADGLGLPDHARMILGLAPRDVAAPTHDVDEEGREQIAELTSRLDAAAVIDATMVMILSTDTNNLRFLDRKLGATHQPRDHAVGQQDLRP